MYFYLISIKHQESFNWIIKNMIPYIIISSFFLIEKTLKKALNKKSNILVFSIEQKVSKKFNNK